MKHKIKYERKCVTNLDFVGIFDICKVDVQVHSTKNWFFQRCHKGHELHRMQIIYYVAEHKTKIMRLLVRLMFRQKQEKHPSNIPRLWHKLNKQLRGHKVRIKSNVLIVKPFSSAMEL